MQKLEQIFFGKIVDTIRLNMNMNNTRLLFLIMKIKCYFHLLLHLSQVIVQIFITAKYININQLQNTMYKFNLSSPEIN